MADLLALAADRRWFSVSVACLRETSPSVSYRKTFLFVPSGAISSSRQRMTQLLPRFSKHPLPH
jgi:hypothetical protein